MHYDFASVSFGQGFEKDRPSRDDKSKTAMQNAIQSTKARIAGAFHEGPKVPAKKKVS